MATERAALKGEVGGDVARFEIHVESTGDPYLLAKIATTVAAVIDLADPNAVRVIYADDETTEEINAAARYPLI